MRSALAVLTALACLTTAAPVAVAEVVHCSMGNDRPRHRKVCLEIEPAMTVTGEDTITLQWSPADTEPSTSAVWAWRHRNGDLLPDPVDFREIEREPGLVRYRSITPLDPDLEHMVVVKGDCGSPTRVGSSDRHPGRRQRPNSVRRRRLCQLARRTPSRSH